MVVRERESGAEREAKRMNLDDQPDQSMDHPSDDARGTKRRQKTKENMRKQRDRTAWS